MTPCGEYDNGEPFSFTGDINYNGDALVPCFIVTAAENVRSDLRVVRIESDKQGQVYSHHRPAKIDFSGLPAESRPKFHL